jgi:hypothetical protein
MNLKFIKTSNRSSFLSIKLLFSGFQISFPMFLNNKNIILNLLLIFTVNCKKYKFLKKYNFKFGKNKLVLLFSARQVYFR